MTIEEIDKEIRDIDLQIVKLNNLKNVYKQRTKDGAPIKIGETYYILDNLSKEIEEIILQENWVFKDSGAYNTSNVWYFYDRLFSSKINAINHMKNLLLNRIETNERYTNNAKISLEKLDKLEIK